MNRKRRPRITGRGHVEKNVGTRGKPESKFTCVRCTYGSTCVPAGCALASGSIDLGRLYVTATTSRLVYTRPLPCYAHPLLLRNRKKKLLKLMIAMSNHRFPEL